jgi:hypothetical protein
VEARDRGIEVAADSRLMSRIARALANAWIVALIFSVITIAATWPLASVMQTRIASDIGDPVFNSWVMMWTGGQVLKFLSGDLHALADYWNGNIFYPERLTIAYSEHLTPQMLQILPVFAFTHNIVLCYNLLFLSAIVLSGVGMYLFVRELTGQPVAAFVAGAAFAFSPYRADQFAHLQVISSQWMPLALYGFQRYFATGRFRALAGAAGAVVIQALSCGYYMLFFTPFAIAFCALEGVRQGAWRHRRTWTHMAVAGIASAVVMVPFILPYMAVRKSAGEFGRRGAPEVRYFSADTWSLGTAPDSLAFWGRMQPYRRPEGSGFPGASILFCGVIGTIAVAGAAARRGRRTIDAPRPWRRYANAGLIVVALALLIGWVRLLVWQGILYRGAIGRITVRHIGDIGWYTVGAIVIALAVSPGFRRFTREFLLSRGGFIVIAWLLAIALAFGPEIYVQGRAIGPGPYALLYRFVPGFDGLRVPARYFMVASFFLAALGGIGVAAIARKNKTLGSVLAILLVAAMVIEGRVAPFVTSRTLWVPHYEYPETTFPTPPNLGAVYDTVKALPDGTVIAELPFGSDPFEIRSMYFAGYHRKPIINGFSGFFPQSYQVRKSWLEADPPDKAAAWKALLDAGVTHVVVHEQPWPGDKETMIENWIRSSGGREIAASGKERLFAIR